MTTMGEGRDADKAAIENLTTGERAPPIHPGSVLSDDFLGPMGISIHTLAKATKLPRSRIDDIVRGRRAVTTDTALRLARFLGTTPEYWRDLQARYDLDVLDDIARNRPAKDVEPDAA